MRLIPCYVFVMLIVLGSCRSRSDLYMMKDFDLEAGKAFVTKIQNLPPVNEISIIDTRADGNNFRVNGQSIYLLRGNDQPNYYSAKKRASELNVSADSLKASIKSFYKIGVNEFNRDSSHYRFEVVVGLTTPRGYAYVLNDGAKVGDTLRATSVRNRNYHFGVFLKRKVEGNWFEYYETR